MQPHFETVQVRKGDVVVPPGEPLRYAYFPESGLSSVVSHTKGARRVEVQYAVFPSDPAPGDSGDVR